MQLLILGLGTGLFLAYANGANDNFKGVATLYGSGTANFRTALQWATLTQVLGSVVALVLAQGLISKFSGKGLVPDEVVQLKSFGLSVGLAAAATVMLATKLGFPISTTHALTGALVGAGTLASSAGVDFSKLSTNFFTPLLVSPLLAVVLGVLTYFSLKWSATQMKLRQDSCVCIGTQEVVPAVGGFTETAFARMAVSQIPVVQAGTMKDCTSAYTGRFFGVQAKTILDGGHFISGGLVGFARALNDTPKIAACAMIGAAFSPSAGIVLVAIMMAVGGLVNSRKVAETISHKVTTLSPGQGFAANLVTSLLVISASTLSLPVSTTHVSCGTLFGIGAATKQAKWKTILSILTAWITTLPVAAFFGALLFLVLKNWI